MEGFQYKHGDRPLEGYTVQRAVGRGGFGEVYFAVSDSGREVALKAVQGFEQIELRGISHCMNLKSPHLVSIFDVRQNDQGKSFVIMEYVAGPSLRELVDESPAGLGAQKAAFFLREMAKGIAYLHERGIVHRDLKPGNVFYEDGYVKIGDYGLSKAMGASQHSGQTVTVGTVHYMAPEIGSGRYDRGIDIYALGVVLYEMLTGQTPYLGASPGEVLMKHLSAEPDLSGVEEPFASVVRKAMAKDPADRYASVQEMVEAVFGAEHVRQSVSAFAPEDLSMAAQRAGAKVAVAGTGSSRDAGRLGGEKAAEDIVEDVVNGVGRFAGRIGEHVERFTRDVFEHGGKDTARQVREQVAHAKERAAEVRDRARQAKERHDERRRAQAAVQADYHADPLHPRQRAFLAIVAAAVVATGTAVVTRHFSSHPAPTGLMSFMMIVGAAWAILLMGRRLLPRMANERGAGARVALGGVACMGLGIAGVACTVLMGPVKGGMFRGQDAGPIAFASLLSMFLVNWAGQTHPGRSERISLGSAFWAGVVGYIVGSILSSDDAALFVAGVMAGISLAVQAACPFDPTFRKRRAQAGRTGEPGREAGRPSAERPRRREAAKPVPGGHSPMGRGPAGGRRQAIRLGRAEHLVSPIVRMLWLIGFLGLFTAGLMLLIFAGLERMQNDQFAAAVSVGLGMLVFAPFCLVKTFQRRFRSWWNALFKPMLMLLCAATVIAASVCLGVMRLRGEETLVATFFIIFPCLMFIVIAAIPASAVRAVTGGLPPMYVSPSQRGGISNRRRIWAMLLALAPFVFPVAGLHRFYVGKVWTGLLWLFTLGFFYIGTIYDLIMIVTGQFTDRHGRRLVIWHNPEELQGAGVRPGAVAAASVGPVPVAEAVAPTPADEDPLEDPPDDAAPEFDDAPEPEPDYAPQYNTWHAPPERREPISLTSIGLSMIGWLLLLASVIVGLGIALNLPTMIQAGLPEPGLAQELEREFGYAAWPSLVTRLSFVALGVLLLSATLALVVARRRVAGWHMIRSLVGPAGMMLSIYHVGQSFRGTNWTAIAGLAHANQPGAALDTFLTAPDEKHFIMAAVVLLLSIVLLAWPPKKAAPTPSGSNKEERSQ